MNRARLIQVFNLGFRRGANDRVAAGIAPSADLRPSVPALPPDCNGVSEHFAWREGYETGYQLGASDGQLASVDVPGAHGMISGSGEEFLELFGFFRRLS